MSAAAAAAATDVQTRKRRDKRKRKDDSDEGISSKSQHGPSSFAEGDSVIHVDHEGGTGGHWCAKIIFFALLGVLMVLIGLIIIENRGLTDLDTPVAESRFAQVFDGWVDEGPAHDDHHDEHTFELKHPEDEHDDELSDDRDEEIEDIESEDHDADDVDDKDHENADDDDDEQDEGKDDNNNGIADEDDDDDEEDGGDNDDDEDGVDNDDDEDGVENDDDEDGVDNDDDEDGVDNDDDEDGVDNDDDEDGIDDDDDDGVEDEDDDQDENVSEEGDQDENVSEEEDQDENVSEEEDQDEIDDEDNDEDDDGVPDDDLSFEHLVESNEIVEDDDDDFLERPSINSIVDDDDEDNDEDDDGVPDDDLSFEHLVESNEIVEDDDDDFLERPSINSIVDDDDEDDKDIPLEEVDSVEEDIVDNAEIEEEHLAAKQAEKLAQEQDNSQNMGMRIGVGIALVLVTYCVLARKWRNESGNDDEIVNMELDRKMTLIPDENNEENTDEIVEDENYVQEETIPDTKVSQKQTLIETLSKSDIKDKEVFKPILKKEDLSVTKLKQENVSGKKIIEEKKVEYEEECDDNEDEQLPKESDKFSSSNAQRKDVKVEERSVNDAIKTEEEEVEDEEDEEVLDEDEELIEEEEEEVEEDISEELDDSELMKKLEEKYGKLPDLDDEPEGHSDDEKPIVPARRKPKPVGGNSVNDEIDQWVADENDDDWSQQLDLAQAEMDEGKLDEAFKHFTALSLTNTSCWRAKLGRAKVLDALAEAKRNNNLLQSTINAYQEVLNMQVSKKIFSQVAERLIDRIRFRGRHLDAVHIQKQLVEKFPDNPDYRNQMAISYLMANKPDPARLVLEETLKLWPKNGVALVHYGFILKTVDNKLKEAIHYLEQGINTRENGTLDGRFLFHLGDALARQGQTEKANKVYELGAALNIFLSSQQRSLYNVDRLTGRPWWKPEQTPYQKFTQVLEKNWRKIAQEAIQLRSDYKPEKENLKDTGDWTQFELFIRGDEVKNNCAKCPITCNIARTETAARYCRRGQIKFSAMSPGTHVFAHTGPTNCRLRVHLGLKGTQNTYIRVGNETRSWEEGKVLIFDDSFEHEVWHNGTELRIVLIIDLWHPELTEQERLSLPAI